MGLEFGNHIFRLHCCLRDSIGGRVIVREDMEQTYRTVVRFILMAPGCAVLNRVECKAERPAIALSNLIVNILVGLFGGLCRSLSRLGHRMKICVGDGLRPCDKIEPYDPSQDLRNARYQCRLLNYEIVSYRGMLIGRK